LVYLIPWAIVLPIPRLPPVTKATRDASEKRLVLITNAASFLRRVLHMIESGKGKGR
jgi:hypothetical protein